MIELREAGFYSMYDSANKQLLEQYTRPAHQAQEKKMQDSDRGSSMKQDHPPKSNEKLTKTQKRMSMFEFNEEQAQKINLLTNDDSPAHVAQYNADRRAQHDAMDLTRKAEEMFSKAFEDIVTRMDDASECNKAKFDLLDRVIEKQEKSLQALKETSEALEKTNQEKQATLKTEIGSVDSKLANSIKGMRQLLGRVESSLIEQLKVPQIQIL